MLSFGHMVVIFIVVLVVLGPEKLPQVARTIGKVTSEFRRITNDFRSQIEDEMREVERQTRIKQEAERLAKAGQVPPAPEGTEPRIGGAMPPSVDPGAYGPPGTIPEYTAEHVPDPGEPTEHIEPAPGPQSPPATAPTVTHNPDDERVHST